MHLLDDVLNMAGMIIVATVSRDVGIPGHYNKITKVGFVQHCEVTITVSLFKID